MEGALCAILRVNRKVWTHFGYVDPLRRRYAEQFASDWMSPLQDKMDNKIGAMYQILL